MNCRRYIVLAACSLAFPAWGQQAAWHPVQQYLAAETGYAPPAAAAPQPQQAYNPAPYYDPYTPEEYAYADEADEYYGSNPQINEGVRGMNLY